MRGMGVYYRRDRIVECIRNGLDFRIGEPTVISLGKFDGLHRGHELLVRRVEEEKQRRAGLRSVAFTFGAAPGDFADGKGGMVLTTSGEKQRLFEERGLDYYIECPFSEEVMRTEAEDFIRLVAERLCAKHIVVGADFRFGHRRRGDCGMLRQYAGRYGYGVTVVEKLLDGGREISSTWIREEIAGGNLEKANELLGHAYFAEGTVRHGEHMGTEEFGIPTLNIRTPGEKLLPPYGVYLTVAECGDARYASVTDVGCKPTIGEGRPPGIETYLLDVSKDLYGRDVKVSFCKKVREERKFQSIEELKEQMQKDIRLGREYFRQKAESRRDPGLP